MLLLLIGINFSSAQSISLNTFNKDRVKITKQSMVILGSWGAANLIYNGATLSSAKSSNKYFKQMNLIWGGVNSTLGIAGFFAAKNQDGLNFYESLKKQMLLEKVFLFNTGLDVAYVATGLYIKEKSKNNTGNTERNKGYGNSIMLQGTALFLFDGLLFLIHQNHGKQLYKFIDKVQIGSTLNGFGFTVKM